MCLLSKSEIEFCNSPRCVIWMKLPVMRHAAQERFVIPLPCYFLSAGFGSAFRLCAVLLYALREKRPPARSAPESFLLVQFARFSAYNFACARFGFLLLNLARRELYNVCFSAGGAGFLCNPCMRWTNLCFCLQRTL